MSAHLRAQLLRFLRLTAATLVPELIRAGGEISWVTLWTLLPGAVEAALRQMRKVEPVAAVTSEPALPGAGRPS